MLVVLATLFLSSCGHFRLPADRETKMFCLFGCTILEGSPDHTHHCPQELP